jgi:hypothetical protein
VLDPDARVVRAVQQQRRHPDRAEHVADVEVAVELHRASRLARSERHPLEPPEPLAQAGVVGVGGGEARREGALAPVRDHLAHRCVALLGAPGGGVVVGARAAREGGVERERAHALGGRGREQHRHRAALHDRDQVGARGAGGVHHRAHVVDLLLERGRAVGAVRHPRAAAVVEDHPAEPAQALEEARDRRVLPQGLDGGERLRHEDDVALALADRLIGERDAVAGACVLGSRCHGGRVRFRLPGARAAAQTPGLRETCASPVGDVTCNYRETGQMYWSDPPPAPIPFRVTPHDADRPSLAEDPPNR